MNWLIGIVITVLLLFGMTNCTKVPAGNVGVKVYLLGGSKGVETEELGVGRYWIGINEELYLFPTFTQNVTWAGDKAISFQDKDGLVIDADFGVSFHIRPEKVTSIFQKYRKGIEEIEDIFVRNTVRDAVVKEAAKLPAEAIYGPGKDALMDRVTADVRQQVSDIGIDLEKVYLVGNMRLPANVIEAINAKIGATQRAQQRENEIREAEAQAQKKIAEANGEAASILAVAKAQADANKLLTESISENLVRYKAIEKWNGVSPTFLGAGMPMIQMPHP